MKRPDELKADRRRMPLQTWAAVTIGLLGVGVAALALLFFITRSELGDLETQMQGLCERNSTDPACQPEEKPPTVFVLPPGTTLPLPPGVTMPPTTTTRPAAATTTTTNRATTTTTQGGTPPPPTTTTTRPLPTTTTSTTRPGACVSTPVVTVGC